MLASLDRSRFVFPLLLFMRTTIRTRGSYLEKTCLGSAAASVLELPAPIVSGKSRGEKSRAINPGPVGIRVSAAVMIRMVTCV